MAFLGGLFRKKPGGSLVGNLIRSVIPASNMITHLDDEGNKTGWVYNLFH